MNGNSMLGGVGGFMTGWRFGREMVEGDDQDRKARAATLAAQEEAATKAIEGRRKIDMEAYKEQGKNNRYEAGLKQTQIRDGNNNANAEANIALAAGGLGLRNAEWNAGAPMRDAQYQNEQLKNEEARLRTQKQQADAAYVDERRKDVDEFEKWTRGDASMDPERASRWDTVFRIATQDPKPAMAALQKLLPQAAELMKQGKLEDVSRLWGSPEGKVAMQAWEPAYKTAVGKPVEGGRYVIQDAQPNRLEMVDAGDKKGPVMILDVSIAPSKQFAEELTRQRAAAKTPEEIARIDRQLAPSTYQAPLTEGRVPIGEGGKPRVFTQEEFAKGVSNLQQRLAFHEQHPDEIAKIRRRLLARASGTGISDSLKAEAAMDNTLIQEELKRQDQAMRQEGLGLKREGLALKRAGKDNTGSDLNRKFSAVDNATRLATRDTFNQDGDRQSVSRELLDYQQQLNIRTKDVLSRNPELGIEQAFEQAKGLTPLPESEVDKQMANIRQQFSAQPPAQPQGMSPTGNIDGLTATNPTTGQKMVLRNGRWQPQ
jgi:hypothetical protein